MLKIAIWVISERKRCEWTVKYAMKLAAVWPRNLYMCVSVRGEFLFVCCLWKQVWNPIQSAAFTYRCPSPMLPFVGRRCILFTLTRFLTKRICNSRLPISISINNASEREMLDWTVVLLCYFLKCACFVMFCSSACFYPVSRFASLLFLVYGHSV